MGTARFKVNTIIPEVLYQRGQILSWKREEKLKLIEEYNVGVVVNFWAKVDPDMSEMPCWYWHIPSGSQDMLEEKMYDLAGSLAQLLEYNEMSALILCEAGKTRSVFFSTMVLMHLLKCSGSVALDKISKKLSPRLKPYMIEYLRSL